MTNYRPDREELEVIVTALVLATLFYIFQIFTNGN